MSGEIGREFFQRDPVVCARELIGGLFHWGDCSARIVETEAYAAEDDPACHTWFRPSARAFVEKHPAGAAYVYLNYGVHWLFNILVKGEMDGFVLFRAVEPCEGIEFMRQRRPGVKDERLGAGPGCLTRALGIHASAHGRDFFEAGETSILLGDPGILASGPRIGISKAVDLPWRFGDTSSRSLSRKFGNR